MNIRVQCTRYTELCILGCAWPRRTRVFTRPTPAEQPWKSRDVRRVRDCVHACIRPFVCAGFDRELPLRGGGETRANQSPSAFGFATPYVHHPPTSPEFRWSSPGNRFISPPFLSFPRSNTGFPPSSSLDSVRGIHSVANILVAPPPHPFSPVCFYLREDVPANFIPHAPQRSLYQWMHVRLPFIRIAASSVIEGWSEAPSRWWGDKMKRWRDIGRFIWKFDLGFFFNLWNHLDVYAKFESIKIWRMKWRWQEFFI